MSGLQSTILVFLTIGVPYYLSRVLRKYPLQTAILLGLQLSLTGGFFGIMTELSSNSSPGIEIFLIPTGLLLSLFSLIRPSQE